jgi:preprotein translocase subunit YajC
MNLHSVLLQTSAPGASSSWGMFVPFALIFIVFYFFMIRPQTKKAKEAKAFRESLQKGAKVVTIGGLHGTIVEVSEKTVLIQADSNVKLRFEKTAIATDSTMQLTEETVKGK